VAAVNAAGTSAYSALMSRVTPLAAMTESPRAYAGNGYVTLRWIAPALKGMPPITDYAIRYSSDKGLTWIVDAHTASTATSCRITLVNGLAYIFQVAPVVSGGLGSFSLSSSSTTPISPNATPVAPSGVVGVTTGVGVTLSWKSVAGNTGGPVTDYVVQYRVNLPNTPWLPYQDLESPLTSATLRLRAGYTYVFRVAAKNLAGVGAYSSQSSPVSA